MRLGGRLSAAIDVLTDMDTRRRPVADGLKDWGLSHRFAGSGDRAAIGNIVYDALRMKLSHAYLMDDDSPRAAVFAVMLRQWGTDADRLARELEGDSFAPQVLSEAERKALETRNLASAPDHVQADLPEWIVPRFATAFGGDWLAEAQAMTARPPLDLRVNTLKASRDKVLKALDRTGASPTAIAPQGLRIAPITGAGRHPNVTSELSFRKGWFEVQDEGSQIVAALSGAMPGEKVLDFCAGGGGKTLALSAAMENKGQIHAFDADRIRLAPIIERLKRAGTRNVQVHDRIAALEPLRGRMDRVLVDAPCTGTGTWRRRPDTKWRLTEQQLAERCAQQDEVLRDAAAYVRPGGRLIYITCSVLPDENEARIAAFVADHPDFKPVPMLADWQTRFGADAARPRATAQEGLMLTPKRTGTDGFFFAMLERQS
jgi:16S rRNA (cytosine967-C5)-methyltransferase